MSRSTSNSGEAGYTLERFGVRGPMVTVSPRIQLRRHFVPPPNVIIRPPRLRPSSSDRMPERTHHAQERASEYAVCCIAGIVAEPRMSRVPVAELRATSGQDDCHGDRGFTHHSALATTASLSPTVPQSVPSALLRLVAVTPEPPQYRTKWHYGHYETGSGSSSVRWLRDMGVIAVKDGPTPARSAG